MAIHIVEDEKAVLIMNRMDLQALQRLVKIFIEAAEDTPYGNAIEIRPEEFPPYNLESIQKMREFGE